jgi:hypothetical protein
MAEQVDPNTLSDEALGIPKKSAPSTWAEVNAQKKDADLAAMDAYLAASKMGPVAPEGAVPSSTLSPVALRAQGSNSIPIGGEVGGYQQPPAYAAPGSLPTDVAPKAPEFDMGKETVALLKKGLKQQAAAAIEGAAAGTARVSAEIAGAKLLQDNAEQNAFEQKIVNDYRAEDQAKIEKDMFNLSEEIKNGKIQPNRIWNNLDTAGKIGMGISMILGGVGSALTKGPNMAVDQLNRMIEADTEAQKAELASKRASFDTKNSLYSRMLARYGNEDAATAAANIQKTEAIKYQIIQESSKYKNAELEAIKLKTLGELNEKQATDYGKLRETIGNSAESMAQDSILKGIARLPKELHKTLQDEYKTYKGVKEQVKRVDTVFDEIAKIQTVASRLGSPVQSTSIIKTHMAEVFPIVKAIMGEKMSEGDVENFLKPMTPGVTDSKETIDIKRQKLQNALNAGLAQNAGLLRGYGLLPKEFKTGAPTK